MTCDQQRARDFAMRMIGLGFRVYLAERGDYGFVTDSSESRVLGFAGRSGDLSGTYGPPSTTSGTGWRMDKNTWDLHTAADVREALYAPPPPWCGDGWLRVSTVKDYLALYQASSRFARFAGEERGT